jgi:hypothetical protein
MLDGSRSGNSPASKQRLSYLDNGNMDSMFLLHKGKGNH